MNHYLSIILFTPLAGALLLLFVSKQNENAIRWIANIVALIGFAISIPLWFWYNPQNPDFQFIERVPWITSIGAERAKSAASIHSNLQYDAAETAAGEEP
jgi:NADH-quinone oxidoreductase subunit M